MLLQQRPFLVLCHPGTTLLNSPAWSSWPHDHSTRNIKCTVLIVDCMPAEPGSEVSSVVAGGNYWMSIMTQSSLRSLMNRDCHSVINTGWVLLVDVAKPMMPPPHCCWLPDFPLTLLPWQQSPGNGTLNRDTWVLLISHVESLSDISPPHTIPGYPLLLVLVCPHLRPRSVTAGRGTLCCVPSGDPVSQPVGAHCDAILRIVTRKK